MRSCWQKRLSRLRTGVHDVFAVVQHDQGMAPGKMSREFLDHGAGADVPHAQSFRRRADHGLRVQYGCQVHQPHPVRKSMADCGGRLQRQPGLTDTARPGERQEPRGAEEATDLGNIAPSADESGQRRGQVPRP